MARLINNVNIIRQKCASEKRKATISNLFLKGSRNRTNRESQIAIGCTEETCRHLDQIAREDQSYTATKSERQRYETNWKLALNAQGPVLQMHKREDYLTAVKTTKNLRQQDEQPSNPPILPSYKTRHRPLQERHQKRQWMWRTWSDSHSSSSAWAGSQSARNTIDFNLFTRSVADKKLRFP